MSLAFSKVRQGIDDRNRFVECDVTFDSSYPTGGEAVSVAALGLKEVRRVAVVHDVYPDGGTTSYANHGQQVVPVLTTPTAPLLKIFTSASTEAGDTTDQSGVISRIRFIGS